MASQSALIHSPDAQVPPHSLLQAYQLARQGPPSQRATIVRKILLDDLSLPPLQMWMWQIFYPTRLASRYQIKPGETFEEMPGLSTKLSWSSSLFVGSLDSYEQTSSCALGGRPLKIGIEAASTRH